MFLEEDMNAMPSDGGMQNDDAMTKPMGDDTAEEKKDDMGDMEEKKEDDTEATEEAAM